jgi:hypothetical protein
LTFQESAAAEREWARRAAAYDAAVATQLAALRAAHGAALAAARAESEVTRPARGRPSQQFLQQRRMEEMLVKQVGGAGKISWAWGWQ